MNQTQSSKTFLLLIFVVAFVINFVWEMGQMFAYEQFATSAAQTWLICGLASIGDAVYISVLYWLGHRITHDRDWIAHLNGLRILTLAGAGLTSATLIEWIALVMGIWSYSEAMIRLPLLEVGILPVLQLMILPVLTFWIVGQITQRSRI
ncbi:hypothetical protein CEN49_02375 [Fischerella thermalis CCMEE 5273]|nr:hypothetical protein [Chlorogloeopsis fritschii]PMB11181.1 hypothetical protein CEN49_02375 [Fischerella thermalis CCMEE 5273]PMB49987.1 hypothetical protein CEN40_03395 [Fischerella thermalis CCMEE 5205]